MHHIGPFLRLGIIGATGTAYKRTLPALVNSEICSVTAIQCRDMKIGREVADKFNISKVYHDREEMLAEGPIDAVFIATPPYLHKNDIGLSIKYDKHIICEKPLALNLSEAARIADVIGKSSLGFMLAHHLRHQPAFEKICNLIENKRIGNVLKVWMQWDFIADRKAKNASWKFNKDLSGGGAFIDVGSHCVDIAIAYFGLPYGVTAKYSFPTASSVESDAAVTLHYDSMEILIKVSFDTAPSQNDLVIQGEKGRIICENFFSEKSTLKLEIDGLENKSELIEFPAVNPYREEVENFARSLKGDIPAGTGIKDAVNAMRIIEAAELSARNGISVGLENIAAQ
ncbi:MAG: Gfo/Idh/MocA family oxidoreductase [Candidatus Zixiibacteriota bacterium]